MLCWRGKKTPAWEGRHHGASLLFAFGNLSSPNVAAGLSRRAALLYAVLRAAAFPAFFRQRDQAAWRNSYRSIFAAMPTWPF